MQPFFTMLSYADRKHFQNLAILALKADNYITNIIYPWMIRVNITYWRFWFSAQRLEWSLATCFVGVKRRCLLSSIHPPLSTTKLLLFILHNAKSNKNVIAKHQTPIKVWVVNLYIQTSCPGSSEPGHFSCCGEWQCFVIRLYSGFQPPERCRARSTIRCRLQKPVQNQARDLLKSKPSIVRNFHQDCGS